MERMIVREGVSLRMIKLWKEVKIGERRPNREIKVAVYFRKR